MRKLALLGLLLSSLYRLEAQTQPSQPEGPGIRITGRIIDSNSRQPIQYATISVYAGGAARPAGGMMTGSKGEFSVSAPRAGEFSITVECIGYAKLKLGLFPADGKRTSLGDILLSKEAANLQSVTV